MHRNNTVEDCFFDKLSPYAVAGTSDIDSASIATHRGTVFEFMIALAAVATGGNIIVQGSNDDSSFTSLDTTAYTTSMANSLAVIEVRDPNWKFLRIRLTRAGNVAVDNIVVRVYPSRITPAPAGDAVIRKIVPYPGQTLPNSAAVSRTV